MTGTFWLGAFVLSVVALFLSVIYLIWVTRKQKSTDSAKNLMCTFLILTVVSSVGVSAHGTETGAQDAFWGGEECTEESTHVDLADFDAMYNEYMANELRADARYKGKRYMMAATIMGFSGGDTLSVDSSIEVTMAIEVEDVKVPVTCKFDSHHREKLMQYEVGDVVIFEGTCVKAWEWRDCEMR